MKKSKSLLILLLLMFALASTTAFHVITQHPVQRPIQVIINPPAKVLQLDAIMRSVVRIKIDDYHTGSGFIIDESGLIITAKHVVDRQGKYIVIFSDGAKRKVQGIRMSEKSDCAVLSVARKDISALKTTADIYVSQPILVIGTPFDIGLTNYVTAGIISKIGVYESFFCNTPLIMIDADGNPGNSGGPVLNMKGEVIGIVVGGYGSGIGINYAVSSVDFIDLLESWRDEGENWDEKWGPESEPEPEWQSEWEFQDPNSCGP